MTLSRDWSSAPGLAQLVHEPDAMRLLRREPLARQQVSPQRPIAERAQEERDQRSGREPEPHFGNREERVAARDDDIAAARQRERAADAGALHRRDGRLGGRVERQADIGDPVSPHGPVRRFVLRRDSGAGREVLALAAQDHHAHGRIVPALLDPRRERVEHILVVAVRLVGPVEPQGRDAAIGHGRQDRRVPSPWDRRHRITAGPRGRCSPRPRRARPRGSGTRRPRRRATSRCGSCRRETPAGRTAPRCSASRAGS